MKNKTKRIIKIICAILLIITIQMIGITYAKYITTEKGTGSANIAKWGFEIVKDGQTTKTVSLVNDTEKSSVQEGKIAPGSSGIIEIELSAKGSEVNVDYAINFEKELNKPTNMIFLYGGKKYESLTNISSITGTIECDSEVKNKVIKILWEWPYQTGETTEQKNQNNIIDTQDSQNISQYTFDIVVSGSQGL